jgi:uncharacterized phage-like protein YoqJ
MGISREDTCCFSGYRPEKLPWGHDERDERCVKLKRKLFDVVEALYISGIRHFVCGMAAGSDMYFCEAALALRDERVGVTVEAALPCEGQADRWARDARERYFDLLARCDIETLVSRRYSGDCMKKRNRYMVDKSSVIVLVYDGKFGGTMYTKGYAERSGLEVISIMP